MANNKSQVPLTALSLRKEQHQDALPQFNLGFHPEDGPPPPPLPPAYAEMPYTPPSEQMNLEANRPHPPPPALKYICCPACSTVMNYDPNSTLARCPKPNCKITLDLASGEPVPLRTVQMLRAICIHCKCVTELLDTSNTVMLKCPHCREVSTLKPSRTMATGRILALIGILILAAAIVVTVVTVEAAKRNGGTYVVWIAAYIGGIMFLLKACGYCLTPTSFIEEARTESP